MALTYEPIQTTTLGSVNTTVNFNSIPSSYDDLVLVYNLGQDSAANIQLRFNSDTGANYGSMIWYGTGTTAASGQYPNLTYAYVANGAAALPSTIIAGGYIVISNYNDTNEYKSVLSRYASATQEVTHFGSTWRSTSAITSIQLSSYSGGYLTNSTFTLYGIKAA